MCRYYRREVIDYEDGPDFDEVCRLKEERADPVDENARVACYAGGDEMSDRCDEPEGSL